MAGTRFDVVAKRLAAGLTRRDAVRGWLAAAAAATVGGVGLEAEARRKPRRCKPKKAGALCKSSRECCPKKTKRICKQPLDSGNSDKVCCGGQGATCGGANEDGDNLAPKCCMGFRCSTDYDPDDPNPPFPPNTKGKCVRANSTPS